MIVNMRKIPPGTDPKRLDRPRCLSLARVLSDVAWRCFVEHPPYATRLVADDGRVLWERETPPPPTPAQRDAARRPPEDVQPMTVEEVARAILDCPRDLQSVFDLAGSLVDHMRKVGGIARHHPHRKALTERKEKPPWE